MNALDRKLVRDLWHMWGQALAICLVMACGVATFVMSLSTLRSLEYALQTYYERNRFADVFAQLKRAPKALAGRLAELPGVARVETRVVLAVTLDMPGLREPAVGQLVSLPTSGQPALNQLYLRRGRWLVPGRAEEALVSESFADAHKLNPGGQVVAIINGRKRSLRIVGVVLSPEYVYQIGPGDIIPDPKRYGVLWLSEPDLAAAYDMQGAFNDVSVRLMPGANADEVVGRIDRLTYPYGGQGAYPRSEHISHQFVSNEIKELRNMAVMTPSIFLGVAAFLLNVVMSRLIGTQREQIAALKAFGYGRWEIGWHYVKMVLVLAAVGLTIGVVAGAWLGSGLTAMYTKFYHFPVFEYRVEPFVVASAVLVAGGASLVGVLGAVRRATRLQPAEAMRPEPPASFRPALVERLGLQRFVSPGARMVLRQLERRPLKSLLSAFAIGLAVAVLVLGNFMEDSVNSVIDTQFHYAKRGDVTVIFAEPAAERALHDLQHLPGVQQAEPFRNVSVRIRGGPRTRRIGVQGVEPGGTLNLLVDIYRNTVELPDEGLVLSRKLADLLSVRVGDTVTIEVLEGQRPVRDVMVTSLVNDFAGLNAYMSRPTLNRLMREGPVISGAYLTADKARLDPLYRRLKDSPRVAGVLVKEAAVKGFQDTIAENMLRFKMFNVFFASVIAFGVVYNTVRIALSERSRELATLRVIGFTRAEVSRLLLGELAVLCAVAIPGGLVLGYGFALGTSKGYDMELFRIPLVIYPSTYGFAATVVLIAATVSGLIVRRRIDHLDLVEVLKTKE